MGHRIATLAIAFVATIVTLATPLAGAPTSAGAPTPLPDLVLVKSDNPDPVASGDPLTYSIVVSNDGTASAGSPSDPINIRDQLPMQFSPTPSFSIAPTGSCGYASGHVDCRVDTLAPGDSVKLTIDGYVTLPFGGEVENIGFVDLPVSHISETIEVNNNIESETTTILAITTPTPTPSATPTPTATASFTPTRTLTPTATPRPVGGFSLDPGGSSGGSGGPARVILLSVVTVILAGAGVRYVAKRARMSSS